MPKWKLLKCPFCFSESAPELLTAAEVLKDVELPESYAVCCALSNGGCGATGGYNIDKYVALANWNRRGLCP